MHSPASPPPANGQPTGTAAAAFGMPMPLASLMANGDAGDAITVRIVAAAGYGDGHAATRRAVTGRRSLGAHSVLSLPSSVC